LKSHKKIIGLILIGFVFVFSNILSYNNFIYISNNTQNSSYYNSFEKDLRSSAEKRNFSLIAGPPQSGDWNVTKKSVIIDLPDGYGIDSEGCYAYHNWSEASGINQMPSVLWVRNITMPVDMSDYSITFASLSAIINATVHANDGSGGGIEVFGDTYTFYAIGDRARFYVLISDLTKNNIYEIGYFQDNTLGIDGAGTYQLLTDSIITSVPERHLISNLTSVLSTDNQNFSLTLGIDIFCEDNFAIDTDTWDDLRIKFINLTFYYEKESSIILYDDSGNGNGTADSNGNNILLIGIVLICIIVLLTFGGFYIAKQKKKQKLSIHNQIGKPQTSIDENIEYPMGKDKSNDLDVKNHSIPEKKTDSRKEEPSSGNFIPSIDVSAEEKRELEKVESEIDVEKPKFICIVHKGPVSGSDIYLCPKCETIYCGRCANVLKEKGEKCWVCDKEFNL